MFIAYVGKERCDIAYYIARISGALNEKTLLVDNSKSGDLYRSLTEDEITYAEKFREFSSFTVTRNLKVSEKELEAFDNVILYNGLSQFSEPYEVSPEHIYIAVSLNKLEIKDAKASIDAAGFNLKEDCRVTLVLEDLVNPKFSIEEVAETFGVLPEAAFALPLDETVHMKYEMLMKNGIVSMRKSSSDMNELIKDVITRVFLVDKKRMNKLVAGL